MSVILHFFFFLVYPSHSFSHIAPVWDFHLDLFNAVILMTFHLFSCKTPTIMSTSLSLIHQDKLKNLREFTQVNAVTSPRLIGFFFLMWEVPNRRAFSFGRIWAQCSPVFQKPCLSSLVSVWFYVAPHLFNLCAAIQLFRTNSTLHKCIHMCFTNDLTDHHTSCFHLGLYI